MEDSNIKADLIIKTSYDKDKSFGNIVDLEGDFPDEVENSSFGDLIQINLEGNESYYFIGKGGHLIENQPNEYGMLIIPYEISQYLSEVVTKYSEIDYSGAYLKHDDKFLKKNIGDCHYEWNYRYLLLNDFRTLIVNYPDNRKIFSHQFDILKTTSQDIRDFYHYSFYTEFRFLVKYKFEGPDYDRFIDKYSDLFKKPEVPLLWTAQSYGSGGGPKEYHGVMKYKGPAEFKSDIIKIIDNFYEGFNYEFIWKT